MMPRWKHNTIVTRKYELEGRNGYQAIDEYQLIDGKWRCNRTLICVKSKKLANQIINELNWALQNFISDNFEEVK